MKKILLTLAIIIMAISCRTVPQMAVMDEIKRIDNIQSVRVPVSLLNSLSGLSDKVDNIPGINTSALKHVETIDILTITNSGAKSKARRLLKQFYNGNNYELILQSKQNNVQGLSLYAMPMGNKNYSKAIFINDTNESIVILELHGTMTAEDLSFIKL